MIDGVVNWSIPMQKLTVLEPNKVIPVQTMERSHAMSVDIRAVTVNVRTAIGKYPYSEQ